MIYKLFTDGGSRGNPGPAGIGGQILDENNNQVNTFSKFIGDATNNIAEYKALIEGMNLALNSGYKDLNCVLDSELVVKQVNGIYKVKDAKMAILHSEVAKLKPQFISIHFNNVPRSENKVADKLVNEALDNALKPKL